MPPLTFRAIPRQAIKQGIRRHIRRRIGSYLLLLCAVAAPLRMSPAQTLSRSDFANKSAPSFARMDLNGKKMELSAYRGRVVLLNFWATWCAPCLIEMPVFVSWQSQYGSRGLQVIGISMDDDAPPVRRAYLKYRLNYPVAMGDEKLGELYGGVLGLPVTYLIDRQGKVIKRYEGAVDLKQLEREVQRLLAKR
jgi:cytochrome c biogenesis protein CcmG/thiol:disulfide interchange protein DsbE